MQKKLSEIAQIPIIIQSTLQTISNTFGQLLPPTEESFNENDDEKSETQDNDNYNDEDDSDVENDDNYNINYYYYNNNETDDEDDNTLSTDSLNSTLNNKEITSESDYYCSEQNEEEIMIIKESGNIKNYDIEINSDAEALPKLNEESDENEYEPTEEELMRKQKKEKV